MRNKSPPTDTWKDLPVRFQHRSIRGNSIYQSRVLLAHCLQATKINSSVQKEKYYYDIFELFIDMISAYKL